jgi:succinyl-diaminopimelate desuccinylase
VRRSLSAPSEETEKRILGFIDSRSAEIVRTCSELVKINSENPKKNCEGVVDFLEGHYQKNGIDFFRISADRKSLRARGLSYPRSNFVSLVGRSRKNIGLSIGTHMDVVPAGDGKKWKYPPFSGKIANGKIIGRGACDAKCSLAAQLFAAIALKESTVKLEKSILLLGTVDDEAPKDAIWAGMEFLIRDGGLKKMGFGFPRFAINAEASGLENIWGIFTGSFTLKISFIGRTGHPPIGVNALDSAVSFWSTIKSRGEFSKTRLVYLSGGSDSDFGQTPQSAEMIFRVPVSWGTDPNTLTKLIENLLLEKKEENPEFEFADPEVLSSQRAFDIGSDNQLVRVLEKSATRAGVNSSYGGGIVGAGDLYYFLERGIPGVTFGAGSLDSCHVPDESVSIRDLVSVTKMYALAGLALCSSSNSSN